MSRVDGYNIFNRIGDVFLFGGRGISLWDSTTMAHVFDSGDDLERRASQLYPNTFNGDCSNGNQSPTQQVDERSDDMVRSGFVEILNLYEYFHLSYNLFKRIHIKK